MKKYLITGFSGFVSKHFTDYLENNEIKSSVLGLDVYHPQKETEYNFISCKFMQTDLLEKEKLKNIILQFQPDYILHLASYSSVAFSWQNPTTSFLNNTNIFLNILDVVREYKLKCRILSIGSSEEYGNVNKKDIPLDEDHLLVPVSPYAVARVSQELLSKVYVEGYNLDVVLTRSFNHIGPGQKETFVVASFVKQIFEAKKKGLKKVKLITGNISIIRDFIDVRDVVRAYNNLLQKGQKGEIYNICSGKGYMLNDIINLLGEQLGIKIDIQVDKKLIRPSDNKVIIGSNDKILKSIGWKPNISIEQSLNDMID